jgi:hypothetical protein
MNFAWRNCRPAAICGNLPTRQLPFECRKAGGDSPPASRRENCSASGAASKQKNQNQDRHRNTNQPEKKQRNTAPLPFVFPEQVILHTVDIAGDVPF